MNKAQFWVKPGLGLAYFALNTSRPVFRNNPRLRRAINFAVDRKALREVVGGPHFGKLADRYLPAGFPYVHQGRIYVPPNLRLANSLAQGHLKGGKAVPLHQGHPVSHLAGPGVQAKRREDRRLKVEISADPVQFVRGTASATRRAVRHCLGRLGPRLPRPVHLHQHAPRRPLVEGDRQHQLGPLRLAEVQPADGASGPSQGRPVRRLMGSSTSTSREKPPRWSPMRSPKSRRSYRSGSGASS